MQEARKRLIEEELNRRVGGARAGDRGSEPQDPLDALLFGVLPGVTEESARQAQQYVDDILGPDEEGEQETSSASTSMEGIAGDGAGIRAEEAGAGGYSARAEGVGTDEDLGDILGAEFALESDAGAQDWDWEEGEGVSPAGTDIYLEGGLFPAEAAAASAPRNGSSPSALDSQEARDQRLRELDALLDEAERDMLPSR